MRKVILGKTFLVLFFSLSTCFGLQAQNTTDKNIIEEKVFNAVESLPEVKKLLHTQIMDSDTHIATMIAEKPDGNFKYYWVKVGLSRKYDFETLLHFYVTPKTYEVKYLDVLTDSLLSLKQWRAKNKHVHKK